MTDLKHHDVVILCGGLGTRLQSVLEGKPKPMAYINDRPFLDILIEYYIKHGFSRFVLCIGHHAQYVRDYYARSQYASQVVFSEESEPLGTAGALKNAEQYIQGDTFFVINGDSFCHFDLESFLRFHTSNQQSQISVLLSQPDERSDTGYVHIDIATGAIRSFSEKDTASKERYTNAGIYIFDRGALSLIPHNIPYSLEKSLFPDIVNKGFYGFVTDGTLVDIGTPRRYTKALSSTFWKTFQEDDG